MSEDSSSLSSSGTATSILSTGYDETTSIYSSLDAEGSQTLPSGRKVGSSATGSRDLAGLMRSLRCSTERRDSPRRVYSAASAGVEAECTSAVQLVTTLQQQCLAVEHSYNKLKQLIARLATARRSNHCKTSLKLLHSQQQRRGAVSSGCCISLSAEGPLELRTNTNNRPGGLQQHQQQQHLQPQQYLSSPLAQRQPSLPALTVVVKALLQIAELQASPAAAAALRQQLLQQVKAAAAAAHFSGQRFGVSVALHEALPWLKSAVREACSQAAAAATQAADETAAGANAASAGTGTCASGAAATLERALSEAAEQVQQLASSANAAGQQPAASSSMKIDMDALLHAEMAAALSAATQTGTCFE